MHLLNVEEAYLSINQSLIFSMFSGVHGIGKADGRSGGDSLSKQPHFAFLSSEIPVVLSILLEEPVVLKKARLGWVVLNGTLLEQVVLNGPLCPVVLKFLEE